MVASRTANHIALRNDDAEQHLCLGVYGTRVEIGRDSCTAKPPPAEVPAVSAKDFRSTPTRQRDCCANRAGSVTPVIGVIRAC
jgi:hypothetical protein